MGDFNFDILSSSSNHSAYMNILSDFQHILCLTRDRVSNTSATLIDHAMTTGSTTVFPGSGT